MGAAAALAIAYVGAVWLAASLPRHAHQLPARGCGPRARLRLRAGGVLLLLASPIPWAAQAPVDVALSAWLFCSLPLAALGAAATLAYAHRVALAATGAALVSRWE